MKYKCFLGRASVLLMLRFLLFFTIAYAEGTSGIHPEKEYFVRSTYYRGMLYPHRSPIIYFNEDYINGIAISVGRSFPEIHSGKPPRIGGGLYFSNLGNKDVYGNAFAGYAYFGNYFFPKSGFFNLGSSVSAGISYNTRPFDIQSNIQNQAIGLPLNAFFIVGLDFVLFQNQDFNVKMGPSMVHMSNGKIKVPNSGLNLYTFSMGVSYKPSSRNSKPKSISKYVVLENNLKGLVTGGVRQQNHVLADYEFVSSTILEFTRRVGPVRRLGLGLNYFYNSGQTYTGESMDASVPFVDSYYGVHVAYDIVWGKLSFALNPGIRLWYDKDTYPFYFTRVGIRYEFLPGIMFNCSLKSNSFVAEYIEWGLGYGFSF